jgi:hypothetical protein
MKDVVACESSTFLADRGILGSEIKLLFVFDNGGTANGEENNNFQCNGVGLRVMGKQENLASAGKKLVAIITATDVVYDVGCI